eukprot:5370357-Amphidinium_carterae.1
MDSDAKQGKAKAYPCLACRTAPGKKTWAENMTLTGGKVACIGDRCMQCHTLWQKAFGYLDWQAYAAFIKTEVMKWGHGFEYFALLKRMLGTTCCVLLVSCG